MNRYKFIDLFAGIGGIRIGFESNSMRCVFSSEWDKFAQKTYEENFGEVPLGDINSVDIDSIPKHDILCAGFPCQPFSMIGKREGFNHDTQGNLFFKILDILKKKKPKGFFLENVTGLKTIDSGETFRVIKEELDKAGYNVYVLEENAKDYGVPQNRKRLYFIGFKKKYRRKFKYVNHVGIENYIGKYIESNVKGYEITEKTLNNYLFKKDDGKPQIVNANSKIQVKTLVASYHKIQRLTGTFVEDNGNIRLLSENECKSIMGFPREYKFPVSRTQMYRQMGNSVAVPVVKNIAYNIKEYLDYYENDKDRTNS